MASSSSSALNHTRSNSLPNRQSLVVSRFDEELTRIESSECTASTSTSSKLSHLSGLYDCVEELLQLFSSQESCRAHNKEVEELLEGLIKFLDACSIISDGFLQIKERGKELQSVLRRRRSKDQISKEAARYLRSTKTAMKAASKALIHLKKMNTNSLDLTDMIRRLRDCQTVTLGVVESILVDIAVAPKAASQSLIAKLMKSKRVRHDTDSFGFVAAMDASLNPKEARSQLQKIAMCIKDVEQGVEILFRHLIKTRIAILKILNC